MGAKALRIFEGDLGGVAEWFKAVVLKTIR